MMTAHPGRGRPTRVVLDARALNLPYLRGMGKCLSELVTRTADRADIEWTLLSDRPDLPLHRPAHPGATVKLFEMRGHRFHTWEQIALPRAAQRHGADLLHCPAGSLPLWQPVPTVLTLHDAMPWRLTEPAWQPGFYRDRLIPAAFRRCQAIITVSESARLDIVALWPDLETKLRVIPNGVAERYLDARDPAPSSTLRTIMARGPYLLYLGGEIPRKRFDWALQVLLRLNRPDVQLIACGIEPERCAETLRNAGSVRDRVVFPGFIPEDEMPALYAHAAAVLYPTLYEGFGMPVVEARAVGTPVIFSGVPGLAELTGPGANVVPVEDLEAWTAAAARALSQRATESRPDEAARRWARGYSWDAYVERTLAVYADVLTAARGQTTTARHAA